MLARGRHFVADTWGAFVAMPTAQKTKIVASVAAVAAVIVGVSAALKYGAAEAFLKWVQSLGMWAPVVMIVAFMVASWPIVLLFGILTMASGLMFGIWRGMVTTLVGAVLGGTSVFLLSRFVFRDRVEKYVETDPFFLRLNARIEREGWKLALVMRLASVPFGLLNVLLAVTKLKLLPFVLTTLLGEMPIAFIGCFVGSSLGSLSEAAGGGHVAWTTQKIVLFVVEGVMAITFLVVAFFISKKMVMDSMNDPLPLPQGNATDGFAPMPTEADDPDDPGSYEIDVLPPPVVKGDSGGELEALLPAGAASLPTDSAVMSSVAVATVADAAVATPAAATPAALGTTVAPRVPSDKARMRKTNSVERLASEKDD